MNRPVDSGAQLNSPPAAARPLSRKPPTVWSVSPSLGFLVLGGTLVTAVAALFVGMIFLWSAWHASLATKPMPAFFALCSFAVAVWTGLRVRNLLRERRDHLRMSGRQCTHCGYDVRTYDDAGICPECGGVFDHTPDTWTRLKRDVELAHQQRQESALGLPEQPPDRL